MFCVSRCLSHSAPKKKDITEAGRVWKVDVCVSRRSSESRSVWIVLPSWVVMFGYGCVCWFNLLIPSSVSDVVFSIRQNIWVVPQILRATSDDLSSFLYSRNIPGLEAVPSVSPTLELSTRNCGYSVTWRILVSKSWEYLQTHIELSLLLKTLHLQCPQ